GINFGAYADIQVIVKGEEPPEAINSFSDTQLHEKLIRNIALMNYKEPTPIQRWSIPILLDQRDLIACAQTGNGKTAAYLIPMMQMFLQKGKTALRTDEEDLKRRRIAAPLGLIISPTRELACQIFDEARKFAYMTWVRPAVAYGGLDTKCMNAELDKGADILVATPGRLKDLMGKNRVSLRRIRFLVVDEADRMLDQGFEPDVRYIVEGSDMRKDESRRTAMYSATFPPPIRRMARDFLGDCLLVTVGRVGKIPLGVHQRIEFVEEADKKQKLLDILYEQEAGLTLIFVESKRACDTLDDYLYNLEFPVTSIHSGRSQAEREDAICAFRSQKTPIMIATDVVGRGMDIPNVLHVINYDMPKTIEDYVHRIGRTGRVGNKGTSTTFYNERNADLARDLAMVLMDSQQAVPEFL
ncbi:P-loop containing nucleoside triphosphate hydrolase protein, partial [Blyttiomyces helicus]